MRGAKVVERKADMMNSKHDTSCEQMWRELKEFVADYMENIEGIQGEFKTQISGKGALQGVLAVMNKLESEMGKKAVYVGKSPIIQPIKRKKYESSFDEAVKIWKEIYKTDGNGKVIDGIVDINNNNMWLIWVDQNGQLDAYIVDVKEHDVIEVVDPYQAAERYGTWEVEEWLESQGKEKSGKDKKS